MQEGDIITVTSLKGVGGPGRASYGKNVLYLRNGLKELLDIRDEETERVQSRLVGKILQMKRSEEGNKVYVSYDLVNVPLGLSKTTKFRYVESFFDGDYDIHEFEMIGENQE